MVGGVLRPLDCVRLRQNICLCDHSFQPILCLKTSMCGHNADSISLIGDVIPLKKESELLTRSDNQHGMEPYMCRNVAEEFLQVVHHCILNLCNLQLRKSYFIRQCRLSMHTMRARVSSSVRGHLFPCLSVHEPGARPSSTRSRIWL